MHHFQAEIKVLGNVLQNKNVSEKYGSLSFWPCSTYNFM